MESSICSLCQLRDVVDIATGYGLDDQGVGSLSPGRVRNFHLSMLCKLFVLRTETD
jgi:hypothetical protein